jgi:hypothetical protein
VSAGAQLGTISKLSPRNSLRPVGFQANSIHNIGVRDFENLTPNEVRIVFEQLPFF